jgi:transformation/transcription domain-associated protein
VNVAAHLINRANQPNSTGSPSAPLAATPLQPWEYVDEILGILKTAYPLLSLSMETFVDQIYQRFKCSEDEDAYRLVVALLSDGVQVSAAWKAIVVWYCGCD